MTDTREHNPLGLGPRDRDSSNTGSTEDTSYDAVGSDPYMTGEPRKDFGTSAPDRTATPDEQSRPADPDTTSSEEP